ncbi:MAG: hypothetical protein JW841_03105 [Deltaproteobacteria bacterium]|nr:hypothetical protein [Deltaproteobacteria bacterium]
MPQHFDIAVIGAEPAAVIAAALLCKRGRRVILIDNGEDVSTYGRNNYRLPLAPILTPQIENSAAMHKVHEELGLGPELRAHIRQLSPGLQTVLPHHRFNIYNDPQTLKTELSREFPKAADAIENFLNRLFAADNDLNNILRQYFPIKPKTLSERWRWRSWQQLTAAFARPFEPQQWLTDIALDHPLYDVLQSPLSFFGYLATDRPSTFQAIRLLARYFRGLIELHDQPEYGLPAFLMRVAKRVGVEVRHHATIVNIGLKKRYLHHLDIANDKQTITADYFINGTLAPFTELLPATAQHPRFTLEEQLVRPVGSLLVTNLLVDRAVIPCGMGQVLFVLNGRRQARKGDDIDPPMLLQRFTALQRDPKTNNRKAIIDDKREVLSIAIPVRTTDFAHLPDRLANMKLQILERVGRVVPFLQRYICDMSLPTDTASWDIEDNGTRRVDPWRLHPLYETTNSPLLGISARSPRTFFKNLWHCSHAVLPGLGIEGDYITGLAVSENLLVEAYRKWRKI